MVNSKIPVLNPEEEYLLADYVPQFCSSTIIGNNGICSVASFGGPISYLWTCNDNQVSINPFTIPYKPVTGLIQSGKHFYMIEYTKNGFEIIITDNTFSFFNKINFPFCPVIGPVIFLQNNMPCVLWTEKSFKSLLRTGCIKDGMIRDIRTIAEINGDIFEITVSEGKNSPHFAFTANDSLTAYVVIPNSSEPIAVGNYASSIQFFYSGNQLFFCAVIKVLPRQSCHITVLPIDSKFALSPYIIFPVKGYTSIFSFKVIPQDEAEENILFSIITKNSLPAREEIFIQYITGFNTHTNSQLVFGTLEPPGLIHHNGYFTGKNLVLLHANETINLSVFPLNF